jgi:hypothetical protein
VRVEPAVAHADEDAGADLVAASTDERPGTLLLPSERATKFGAPTYGTPFVDRARRAWGSGTLRRRPR